LKKTVVFLLFTVFCLPAFSQGEIDTQEKILYQNERSISLNLNSNGFGAGFRFGQRKSYLSKLLYDIDFAYIKHPKEVKISASPYAYSNSRRYVYGKTNLFVNLRPSIGYQREIFSKEDRGSLAVKCYVNGGPSIGFAKPVYYNFYIIGVYNGESYIIDTRVEKFEFVQHPQIKEIAGRASVWKGFNEIKVYPGLHAKAGMSFEYSTENRLINAIEVGMVFDAFAKEIPIMYTDYNYQFFLTLFISYRFGWVVDAKYKTPKITQEGQLQRN
jgi:hypothetical protein